MRSIEKRWAFIDFGIACLLRKKWKHAALLLVYTLCVFAITSVAFFTSALDREISVTLAGSPQMVIQRTVAGGNRLLPLSWADEISSLTNVSAVKPRLWGYYYDPTTKANYTVMAAESLGERTVISGAGVLRATGATGYSTMPFRAYDGSYDVFTIGGSMPSGTDLVSADVVLMSEQDFRWVFSIPEDQVNDLLVSVVDARQLASTVSRIKDLLPDSRIVLHHEMLKAQRSLSGMGNGFFLMVIMGAGFALLVLTMDRAIGMSAEEKREIGILKAVGWESRDIVEMKVWEGFSLSFSAFLMGILLGYIHVFVSYAALFAPVLKGWAVLAPELRLTPFVAPVQIVSILAVTVIPYLAATAFPVWKTARSDPDSFIRGV